MLTARAQGNLNKIFKYVGLIIKPSISGVRPHLCSLDRKWGKWGQTPLTARLVLVATAVAAATVTIAIPQTAQATDTGYVACTTWNDGGWVTESNGCSDDTNNATLTGAIGTSQWASFDFGIPSNAESISSISVHIQCESTSVQGNRGDLTNIELSWDGGTNWTSTANSQSNCATSDTDYYLPGDPGDTWGRTWAINDFAGSNFQVKITGDASQKATIVLGIDIVRVKVTYTPAVEYSPTVQLYSDGPDPVARGSTVDFSLSWHDVDSGGSWATADDNAEWISRYYSTSLVFNNPAGGGQAMWVIGGIATGAVNDVWYSTAGTTWTQATAAAQWAGRYGHTSLVFNNPAGGGQAMWVIGGTGLKNDVWYSTNGTTWTQATAAAQWAARYSHTSLVFNNQMWVMGGCSAAICGTTVNDVWYSTNGTTWTQATAAAQWAARYSHTSLVFNNQMWVIGGAAAKNDVWYSTAGTTWTQATAAAQWVGRYVHTSLVFNNQMWVIGGTGPNKNDVWYSTNGTTWTQRQSAAQWVARYGHTSLVFNNQMWVMGGYTTAATNDVWYSNGEKAKAHICKTNAINSPETGGSCPGGSWFSSGSFTASTTITGSFTTTSSETGALRWYPFVCSDGGENNSCSATDAAGINWFNAGNRNDGTGASDDAPWAGRRYYTSLIFNNQMWVIGGTTGTQLNDVWYSTAGTTWTQATAAAQWAARFNHTSLVFNNQMWVMGGETLSRTNDVWYSTNGTTWTQATVNAQWVARTQLASLVFNNQMWVIGGDAAGGDKNDVWYSTNGTTWTQATAAAQWLSRNQFKSLVFNNQMWVIGGETLTTYYNNVWYSTAGTTWTQATANAQWVGRDRHISLVFNNQMWVAGGYDGGGNRSDVWYSTAGTTWTQATAAAQWAARNGHTSLVFNNQMWVMGGFDGSVNYNDVWRSAPAGYFYTNVSPSVYATTDSHDPLAAGTTVDFVVTWDDPNASYLPESWDGISEFSPAQEVSTPDLGIKWTRAVGTAPWVARDEFGLIAYDNKLWVIGGLDQSNGYYNDVWYSTNGATWTQATAAAQWAARRDPAAVEFNGQMWVVGGQGAATYNDVWYSVNGTTWTMATAAAQWPARSDTATVVFATGDAAMMWIYGGSSSRNDVWYSTNGTTWTQATVNAQWAGRGQAGYVAFQNKLWLLGGGAAGLLNDVWYSTAGTTWTQATANAQWVARYYHAFAVFNNAMWVIGGLAAVSQNDVWYSTNGTTWTQATAAAFWAARNSPSAAVYNNKIWISGGYANPRTNDVWYADVEEVKTKVHVCKTNAISSPTTGGSCTGGSWATSDWGVTNPIKLSYNTTGEGAGAKDYWIFTCDDKSLTNSCSSGAYGSFTVQVAGVSVSITTDGIISYGVLSLSGTKDTTASGLNDTQIASNDGNGNEDFKIQGQNTANWTLGASQGSETYFHKFSTNDGSGWTTITSDSYATMYLSVAVGATRDFDLQMGVPSSTSYAGATQDASVTIQATQS